MMRYIFGLSKKRKKMHIKIELEISFDEFFCKKIIEKVKMLFNFGILS